MKTGAAALALLLLAGAASAQMRTRTKVERGSTRLTEDGAAERIDADGNARATTGAGAGAAGAKDSRPSGGAGAAAGSGGGGSSENKKPDLMCGKEKCPPGTVPGAGGQAVPGTVLLKKDMPDLLRMLTLSRKRCAAAAPRERLVRASAESAAQSWAPYSAAKRDGLAAIAASMRVAEDHAYALVPRFDSAKLCVKQTPWLDSYLIPKSCADRPALETEMSRLDAELAAAESGIDGRRASLDSGLRSDKYSRGSGLATVWYPCTDDALPCRQAMDKTLDILAASQQRVIDVWDNPPIPDPDGIPEPKADTRQWAGAVDGDRE